LSWRIAPSQLFPVRTDVKIPQLQDPKLIRSNGSVQVERIGIGINGCKKRQTSAVTLSICHAAEERTLKSRGYPGQGDHVRRRAFLNLDLMPG
jgi:hypothetical protein